MKNKPNLAELEAEHLVISDYERTLEKGAKVYLNEYGHLGIGAEIYQVELLNKTTSANWFNYRLKILGQIACASGRPAPEGTIVQVIKHSSGERVGCASSWSLSDKPDKTLMDIIEAMERAQVPA
jgi:hypothetical protein